MFYYKKVVRKPKQISEPLKKEVSLTNLDKYLSTNCLCYNFIFVLNNVFESYYINIRKHAVF